MKKAGVVDAGGKGLCLIFEGMMSVFKDGYIIPNEEEAAASGAVSKPVSSDDFFRNAAAEFDQDITFTYCTEFIVGRNPEVTASPLELRAYLETIGDCVVVVDDDEIIKTHVHTENPGQALQEALKFGQLLTVKVENMKEQHRIAAEQNEQAKAKAAMETANQFEPGGAYRGNRFCLRCRRRRPAGLVPGSWLQHSGQRRPDHEPQHTEHFGGGYGYPRKEGLCAAQQ